MFTPLHRPFLEQNNYNQNYQIFTIEGFGKPKMSFQDDPTSIVWHLHLLAPVQRVFDAFSTDAGRASFWAESAVEQDDIIHFVFPNGISWDGAVLESKPPYRFAVRYYSGSVVTFVLEDDGRGGTDLTLIDGGVLSGDREEVIAGWVSVLMGLKAAVDFGVDLRTHDPQRTWDQGFVEN